MPEKIRYEGLLSACVYDTRSASHCISYGLTGITGIPVVFDRIFFPDRFGCLTQLAVEFSLPIIDLSRTFDPNNKSHYGSTPIEPSNKSGQFIADLIAEVMFPSAYGIDTTQYPVNQWYRVPGYKMAVCVLHITPFKYGIFTARREEYFVRQRALSLCYICVAKRRYASYVNLRKLRLTHVGLRIKSSRGLALGRGKPLEGRQQ